MTYCTTPPVVWHCTRTPGHNGPCAAIKTPSTSWASPALDRAYQEVDRLRREMAQPSESGIDEALRAALDAIELADIEIAAVAARPAIPHPR